MRRYFFEFSACFCLFLLLGFGAAQAAEPSGKLWVERSGGSSKNISGPIAGQRQQPQRPHGRGSLGSKPVLRTQNEEQGASASPRNEGRKARINGVQRQALPPVQNAPVDEYYGRSGANPSLLDERLGKQRAERPDDLWRRISFKRFRDGLLALDGSGGSLVLNNLVADLLAERRSLPANADPQTVDLLKMVVFYRMGRIADLGKFIATIPVSAHSLPVRIFKARALLAGGQRREACALANRFPVGDLELSQDLLSEALMMTALCAAFDKNLQAVELMATVARDRNIRSPLSYAVMDYLLSGVKTAIKMPPRLGVRDYHFLRLTKLEMPKNLLQLAEPALVYALANDPATPPVLRLRAAERAAARGQIRPGALAVIYADVVSRRSAQRGGGRSDAYTRALLFDGLSRTSDPRHRARIIDTLLANIRGKNLSAVIGPLLAPYVGQMRPEPGLAWFALRAVEVALLARDMQLAERWYLFVKQAGREAYGAAEWLPLTDLVQQNVVPRGEGVQMALRMAKARRLNGGALHRLTSVLDALSYEVPIPLWNLASKQPQPRKGALPAPGILSALKKMSDEGRPGEVLLLSLQAVGANPADKIHLLALGDIVRSLKKTGFTRTAGLFGFEALYGIWPTGLGRQR